MPPLLPHSTPSAQGLDARGVLALVDALEADGHDPHSLVLARHGHVVARGWWAPYSPDRVQLVYSLSKSFTATAVGLLVDEGRLSLDDRVFDVVPRADLPAGAQVADRYRRLTLGHCLTMATGHDTDAWTPTVLAAAQESSDDGTDPTLRAILATPPEHEPGTAWAYNQVATYLAAACVRAASGEGLLDLVRRRVVGVLDPQHTAAVRWHQTATGRELGFSGLHVGTDAVLALAQTHLDGGVFHGRRLLSAEWVAMATRPTGLPNREPDPDPDWRQGYGCSFWGARHGYRGDGAYGQYAIVLPEQDVALALTTETGDMQAVLDLVWEHLLPAFDRPADDAEHADAADAALAERLAGLAVPTPRSAPGRWGLGAWVRARDSELPEAYAGARLDRAEGATDQSPAHRLVLDAHGAELAVTVGDGWWAETTVEAAGATLPLVAAGGWREDGTYAADLRLVETPHRVLLRTRHDGTVWLGWAQVPLHGPDPWSLVDPGRF